MNWTVNGIFSMLVSNQQFLQVMSPYHQYSSLSALHNLFSLLLFTLGNRKGKRNGNFSKIELVNIILKYLQIHSYEYDIHSRPSVSAGGWFQDQLWLPDSVDTQVPRQPSSSKFYASSNSANCGPCSTVVFIETKIHVKWTLTVQTHVVQGSTVTYAHSPVYFHLYL